MPVPSSAEMNLACLAVGTIQLGVLLAFYVRARAVRPGSPVSNGRPAAVIVPCKEAPENLAANAAAMLGQDYPAGAEYIFVAPAAGSPACEVIRKVIAAHPSADARLLISGAVPRQCGEHILNKVHGAAAAGPEKEILIFADSDILVPAGWLRALTGPLEDPSVTAATAPLVFPPDNTVCGIVRSAWVAAGIPYLDLSGCVAGASFAVRKSDYLRLGVEELWRRSLSDDLALTARIKKSGGKVRFVCRVLPVSSERCGLGGLRGMLDKWIILFKFYFHSVWIAGAVLTFFKFYALFRGLTGQGWLPAGIILSMDSLQIYLSLRGLASLRPGLFDGAKLLPAALLGAPLLQIMYAGNFLGSLFASRISWGGYTYRLKGPERVTVESSHAINS